MNIRNVEQLIKFVDAGNRVKYLLFWGHEERSDQLTKTCFSQWYPSPFEVNGVRYLTAEHYMMAEKARLFGDEERLAQILSCEHPGEAKKFGRLVEGFNNETWNAHRFDIVVAGNMGKFGQNDALKQFLVGTGDRVLVEASPIDRIWGIGLAADDRAAENPASWNGLNLLGFALMEARQQLA